MTWCLDCGTVYQDNFGHTCIAENSDDGNNNPEEDTGPNDDEGGPNDDEGGPNTNDDCTICYGRGACTVCEND